MTAITALQGLSFLQQAAATAAAPSGNEAKPAATAAQAQAAPASTVVALGQSGASILPFYSQPSPTISAPVWEASTTDAVSALMANNFSNTSLAGRFQGLGAALLGRIAGGATDYAQSVYQPAPGARSSASLDSVAQAALHAGADNQVSLEITTLGGAKVQLTLGSQDNGLAVSTTVTGGTLSDADRQAILGLSDAFQSAINGLAAQPPTLDLDGLVQFDTSALASVDLHATIANTGGQALQTLDFHADGQQRSLQASGALGAIKINVDMSDPSLVGSADQQAKALAAYLAQFDAERSRGNGDAQLMNMFAGAFQALNSHYASAPAASIASGASATPAGHIALTAVDRSLLTGLADFDASVSQAQASTNPLHPDETDGFDYQLSQHTDVQASGANSYSVTQTQQSRLHASFHQSLTPGLALDLGQDKSAQNYYYDEIDDKAQSQARITRYKGNLTEASLSQSASASTRVREYVGGELAQDVETPYRQSWSQDLLGLLTQPQALASRTAQGIGAQASLLARVNDLVGLPASPDALAHKQPAR